MFSARSNYTQSKPKNKEITNDYLHQCRLNLNNSILDTDYSLSVYSYNYDLI